MIPGDRLERTEAGMSAADEFVHLLTRQGARPEVFVVLGSGMGGLIEGLSTITSLPFASVPGMTAASVEGHRGQFSCRVWAGRPVLVGEGRIHYYEGHPWESVVRPIQFAAEIGVTRAVLTNAAGGIRDDLVPGSLMPLRDHLEWNHPSPWREQPRPSPYSARCLDVIAEIGGAASPGRYASVAGPSYETPSEIRGLRSQGADAVGMSTTREARAAVEAGMEVVAISLVTNRAAGLSAAPLDHAEVMEVGRQAAHRLGLLLGQLIARL
jgi:purine-nucleoside phosphorylase